MFEIWKDAVGYEGYYLISNKENARRISKTKNLAITLNRDGYVAFVFFQFLVRELMY